MTEVRALGPERLDDWLAFFDGPAFADHPEWGTCYCRCFLAGDSMEAWDAACARPGFNREAMIRAIRAREVDGLLAYRDGQAVGWLHHGPTARFVAPSGRLRPADDGLASVVCFVVARDHRRTGVARALLRASVEHLTTAGFTAVDARPKDVGQAESAADEFTGPLDLYLSEGFEVAERGLPWGRIRVRRSLRGA